MKKFLAVAIGSATLLTVRAGWTQTLVENAAETRFQLDLHVPDAAVKSMLPEGFTMNVATQGAAKDANVRLIFVDRVTVNGRTASRWGMGRASLRTWWHR